MRQGGMLPPNIAGYDLAATEPHTNERTGREEEYNVCWYGYP